MKWPLLIFLLLMGARVKATCVFNSDFGFTLNCAFKKSGLFRVRNLGGVKGFASVGFSVGDELGFAQALSNLESDKRRSADGPSVIADQKKDLMSTGRSSSGGVRMPMNLVARTVPPFRPIAPASTTPAPGFGLVQTGIPAFAALPPSIARIPSIHTSGNRVPAPAAFQNALSVANRRFQIVVAPEVPSGMDQQSSGGVVGSVEAVPMMLPSNALANRNSVSVSAPRPFSKVDIMNPSPLLMGHSVQSLSQASNISVEALAAALRLRQQQMATQTPSTRATTFLTTTPSTTTTTTTTTTPKPKPTKPPTIRPKYSLVGPNRVMNAPKEYYPVSYDKNYDDNFTSKVELPDTSFSCGDQKHFPGLYADEDLGCMVFHVCAFTDDGMVMKSFLCPESTLFDQTILKCNWWFYVDCKSSKKLYDSNIPISKSYQLMKALAFFSAYKNQTSNAT